jgi:hypothetical protein
MTRPVGVLIRARASVWGGISGRGCRDRMVKPDGEAEVVMGLGTVNCGVSIDCAGHGGSQCLAYPVPAGNRLPSIRIDVFESLCELDQTPLESDGDQAGAERPSVSCL